MKKILLLLLAFYLINTSLAQHVGIGTTTAPELLTVNGTALIDAGNLNNGFFPNGRVLKFGTFGGVGIGSNKVSGPTYNALEFYTGFDRRMAIDSAGFVGINRDPIPGLALAVNGNTYIHGLGVGTVIPDLVTYKFDVNGSMRGRLDAFINRDLWVDRNFDVDGTSNLFGNVVMSSNLSVSGNITTSGNILTDGNKGIVRSTNSAQQVIAYPSGSVGYTNAPSGYTDDVEFVLPNVFAGVPKVSLAQVTNMSGTFERWTFTIHSVNIATNRFTVRFYNASSGPSTFTATFNFMAVGTAL